MAIEPMIVKKGPCIIGVFRSGMTKHFCAEFSFIMDNYTKGRKLTFERVDLPNQPGCENPILELEIVERLVVGQCRRSQIVLVRSPGADQKTFVAKCFNPSFCCQMEASEFLQTSAEYCESRCMLEAQVYQQLLPLQGQYIPKFYGRYRYATILGKSTAILLEYIQYPLLDNFHDGLPETELLQLLDVGNAALDAIHSRGVYHYDIQPSNVFWNKETKAVRIADWEFSRLNPPSEVAKDWANSDRLDLRRALESCGLSKIGIAIPDNATWAL